MAIGAKIELNTNTINLRFEDRLVFLTPLAKREAWRKKTEVFLHQAYVCVRNKYIYSYIYILFMKKLGI